MSEAQGQKSGPSTIDYAQITSTVHPGTFVDIAPGIVNFRYYESILQDGVKASVMFSDAGNSINGKTVMEGLPLTGSEFFNIKFQDNNGNKIEQKMVVTNPLPVSEETTKSMVVCTLVSEAYAKNDNTAIFDRFDGKISDHVRTILTNENYLATEKELDIEETSNELSEFGYRRKPYYMLNSFAKKSVTAGGNGMVAGYFFFETADKMVFKSIDSLFDQNINTVKRSIIYNESTSHGRKLTDILHGGRSDDGIPAGYDYKAMSYDRVNSDSITRNKLGANSSALISINPFTTEFKRELFVSKALGDDNNIQPLSTAGLDLPSFNPNLVREFARTTMSMFDVGTFDDEPKSDNQSNFEISEILNQSIMRYNQVFATKADITIEGDFSLHAGDLVFFDAPSPRSDTKNDEVDRQSGGLYIIASLCHYISTERTLTKLSLVRDSFGRTGNHTRR